MDWTELNWIRVFYKRTFECWLSTAFLVPPRANISFTSRIFLWMESICSIGLGSSVPDCTNLANVTGRTRRAFETGCNARESALRSIFKLMSRKRNASHIGTWHYKMVYNKKISLYENFLSKVNSIWHSLLKIWNKNLKQNKRNLSNNLILVSFFCKAINFYCKNQV